LQILIQKVFFAFCSEARNASRAGEWTISQSSAVDAVFPRICDFYFVRERGEQSKKVKSTFRAALWWNITDDQQWKQHLAELVALAQDASVVAVAQRNAEPASTAADGGAASWESVEILFLSDLRVQIRNGETTETRNYAEFGFADGRAGNGNPNKAWETLRRLAQGSGVIRQSTAGDWKKVEKRIQEIRKTLRRYFDITGDPIPFIDGTGYQARFKIGCSPSFDA
jgi:hypothetical protein